MARSLNDRIEFLRRVYGPALLTSGLSAKWRSHWEAEHRIRVQTPGGVREGVVEHTRGPEPRWVLRRNPESGGGYQLTDRDRVIAIKRVGDRVYTPTTRRRGPA